jgi:hypothetical protein
MNSFLLLEHWGRAFESHSRHVCLYEFILFLPCDGLIRRQESATDRTLDYETGKSAMAQQRAIEPLKKNIAEECDVTLTIYISCSLGR